MRSRVRRRARSVPRPRPSRPGVRRAALFQELLSRRSSIPLHSQELIYEGRRLVLDPNRQAKTFPKTTRDNPIMLVSRDSVATVGLIFEDRKSAGLDGPPRCLPAAVSNPPVSFAASPPKVQPRYDLDLDASYAKVPAAHAHSYAKIHLSRSRPDAVSRSIQTFAGDVGHLWKTSESLLVYQELVRKGLRGLV